MLLGKVGARNLCFSEMACIYLFIMYVFVYCVYMQVHAHKSEHVEVGAQFAGVHSLMGFNPSTTWVPGSNLGCQVWWQMLLPVEPSCQPLNLCSHNYRHTSAYMVSNPDRQTHGPKLS